VLQKCDVNKWHNGFEQSYFSFQLLHYNTMSTIGRTLKNFVKVGPVSYIKQMNNIGDTKWGRLAGIDANGNKYFENNDEVSGRNGS
jgi:hypothetical protein